MLIHVLNAEIFNNLLKVLRDLFATPEYKILACFDLALHLIYKQTISQHCIVALMTQIAKLCLTLIGVYATKYCNSIPISGQLSNAVL